MRPCFDCSKSALQAKVKAIYYLHPWQPKDQELLDQYERLHRNFPGGVHLLKVDDGREDWANGKQPELAGKK
jgi:dCMP deaminase